MGVPDFQSSIMLAQVVAPPDLTGLPIWAQILGYALFAVATVVIGLIARFGWKMGRTTPPAASDKSAAVAAVIVDPEALNRASAAVLKLDATVGRLCDLVGQIVTDQHEERQEREIEEEVRRRLDVQLREQRGRQRRATNQRTTKN